MDPLIKKLKAAIRGVLDEEKVILFPGFKVPKEHGERSKFSEATLQKAESYIPEEDLEALSMAYAKPTLREKIRAVLFGTD